ncbi:uncharacterized protein LOC116255069 isoform X2 [Nymphaea colorata]|uniref:uncharacterized protein LOC116255069 isoform X2 n=1 Tax=Nymphaea colorata TaxID=210225 RepID=UPI00129EE912|nr:uncharacterized protein LOC116255069 isoform X2 [Nymphaea colorata]
MAQRDIGGGCWQPQNMFPHRRGQSLAGLSRDNRRNLLTTSLDELQHSAISARLERVSIGGPVASKPKIVSAGMDDLLTSDGGKHDYDWLLTPPGTPSGESKPSLLVLAPAPAPIRAPATRFGSATRSSRIPGSQSETTTQVKPTRSRSTSRPTTPSSFLSSSQASKSVLNTSSMSVNSRPSTPTRRTVAPSSQSRPSTPSRTKPPAVSSRPSTPTSRPQIPSTVKPSPVKPTVTPPVTRTASRPSTPTRTASRPSTPTRRLSTETPVPVSSPIVRSPSMATTTRSPALASRARSPSPRPHSRQPLAVHDFSKEVPLNLRTTAPERPNSATRSRPGSSDSIHSTEHTSNGGGTVRKPSPVRGRDHPVSKERVLANGHGTGHMENTGMRVPVSRPPSSTVDNGGFGRTISKKSMDMAIRHMDIRHSTGNMRSLSGSAIFPQSIRSTTPKIRSSNLPDNQPPNRTSNTKILENGNAGNLSDYENGKDRSHIVDLIAERLAVKLKEAEKMKETDLSISTRYDSFLLKEDLKNTEWLHSIDDQSSIFDHRFEQLPEPFGS